LDVVASDPVKRVARGRQGQIQNTWL